MFIRQSHSSSYCTISMDGNKVREVDLSKNGSFTISGAEIVFVVRDGAIAVESSDCPDKTCVRMGFISRTGQKIVCLPNKVVVSVESGGDTKLDAVAY